MMRIETAGKRFCAGTGCDTPTEYGHQRTLEQRQMILGCVRKHSEQYAWGMLIREIMHETGIDDPRTRELCHALLAEGLLELGRVRRGGVRSNAHLYRIGEVQP